MRWAQLTLVEDDPGKFDPQFWLDYFKRIKADAVCLSAGVVLFFVASAAESLRYGVSLRNVAVWAPAGIVLPWVLVPLSFSLASAPLVAVLVGVIAVLVAITEVNARLTQRRSVAA